MRLSLAVVGGFLFALLLPLSGCGSVSPDGSGNTSAAIAGGGSGSSEDPGAGF